jgi:hypothetical protein
MNNAAEEIMSQQEAGCQKQISVYETPFNGY